MPDTQAYLQLIQDLFTCHNEEEANELLQTNTDLLDDTFLQLLETVAQHLAKQSPKAADFLRDLAAQLGGTDSEQDPQTHLHRLLATIEQTKGDPQTVYALLQQQPLTAAHLPALEKLWQDELTQLPPEHHPVLAALFDNFGILIQQYPLGNRVMNLELGITACQLALQVCTRETLPQDWARMQNNLGEVYRQRIVGSRAENLERAIQCYENALQVSTRETLPQHWADTQNNLGIAYLDRIQGARADNLEQAIRCYANALQVRTREAFPQYWAETQTNLGTAYHERIQGVRAENLEQAIRCHENALQVHTREALPRHWAMAQANLANAYSARIVGSRAKNLEQAIQCHENALQVFSLEALPRDWASTQYNLGEVYRQRIVGSRAENLEQAIRCHENTLQVYTSEAFPQYWAITQNSLGNDYVERIAGGRAENLEQAIQYYANALQVRTREAFPQDWAMTQNNLGNAYRERIQGARAENLEQAIRCYENALQVRTREALPQDCMDTLNNRGWAQLDAQDWAGARQSFNGAMEILDDLRLDIQANDEAKHKLADFYHQIYRGAIRACVAVGDVEAALLTLERGKTRWLAERIAYGGDLPEDKRQALRELKRELIEEQAQAQPDTDKLNALRQQYNALDPLPRLEAAHLTKLAQERLVLVWHLDGEFFQVFALSAQGVRLWKPTAQNWDSLLAAVVAYRKDYYQDRAAWQQNLDAHLQALATALCWDELCDWIAQTFPAVKELVLIPHRWLHLLPLHALPLKKGGCLLDDYTVRYAPSLQILQQIQRAPLKTLPQRWFAVQNPTNDLSFADIEVMALTGLFPASAPADVLVQEAATRSAVLQHPALTQAPVLHFSCHGGFNPIDPMQSALSLANNKSLTLQDIFAQRLPNAHLVTLSACETGMTDFQFEGDEYIGLSSGFLSAGARHVISTLWSVNEASTMLLLLRFYHEWLKSQDSDIAPTLNAAQRWLRQATAPELREWAMPLLKPSLPDAVSEFIVRNALAGDASKKPFESPFHWAAFCAVG